MGIRFLPYYLIGGVMQTDSPRKESCHRKSIDRNRKGPIENETGVRPLVEDPGSSWLHTIINGFVAPTEKGTTNRNAIWSRLASGNLDRSNE